MNQSSTFILIALALFFIFLSLYILNPSPINGLQESQCQLITNNTSDLKFAKEGRLIFDEFLSGKNRNLFLAKSTFKPHYYIVTADPSLDIHVSKHMHDTGGFYDRQVHYALDFLIAKNGRCGVVFDVGANFGTLTLYAAAKGCQKVYSFELQKEVAEKLDLSIKLSGFQDRVSLMKNTAVSSEDGKIVKYHSLPENPGGVGISGSATADLNATTITLDTFYFQEMKIKQPIFFMKVDIEGHEEFALMGSTKLFKKKLIQNLVIELRPHQAELMKMLYSNGFTCKDIRSSVEVRSPESIMADESSSYLLHKDIDELFQNMTSLYFLDFYCHL